VPGIHSNGRLRFVIADSDGAVRASIKKHLGQSGHRVMGEAEDAKAGARLARGVQPDGMILALGSDVPQTLELVAQLREALPALRIIMLSSESTPQLLLDCMRAGVNEFLSRPVDLGDLDRAIERLGKTSTVSAQPGAQRGRVLSVYSAKGGAGGSSVATNLALALNVAGERVVLVDFNLQVGDLALMLDMVPSHTFSEALADDAIDRTQLNTLLASHSSGLRLLTVSDRPEESDAVQRAHIPELFGHLSMMFDWVVIDLGRHIDDRTIELFDLSDGIVMVSIQDVPGIRNARRYADLLERLEIPPERIHLVVNRHHQKSRVSVRDVEDTVGLKVFWSLPNDFRPMSAAIDSGCPIVLDAPKSKLTRSFVDLADAFAKLYSDGRSDPALAAAVDEH
jgi:pilus assembly protein CpaE